MLFHIKCEYISYQMQVYLILNASIFDIKCEYIFLEKNDDIGLVGWLVQHWNCWHSCLNASQGRPKLIGQYPWTRSVGVIDANTYNTNTNTIYKYKYKYEHKHKYKCQYSQGLRNTQIDSTIPLFKLYLKRELKTQIHILQIQIQMIA